MFGVSRRASVGRHRGLVFATVVVGGRRQRDRYAAMDRSDEETACASAVGARVGRCSAAVQRARLVPAARDDGLGGDRAGLVHHRRRADRRHRAVLDGARAAGEDRAQAPPSAARRDPDAVPAVAGVRRPAVADRLAVGLHEAGRLQDGLRHRQARGLLPRAWARRRRPASCWTHELAHLREELDAHGGQGRAAAELKVLRSDLRRRASAGGRAGRGRRRRRRGAA